MFIRYYIYDIVSGFFYIEAKLVGFQIIEKFQFQVT